MTSDEQDADTPTRPRAHTQRLALTWAEGKVLSSRGLRLWAASLKKHSPETRIVILSPESVTIPGTENCIIDPANRGGFVLHRRWSAFSSFLSGCRQDACVTMLSDCRDLVFQSDPFALLDSAFVSSLITHHSSLPPIVVCSEQQRTADHPWTKDKAQKLEGKIRFKQDLNRVEINGGLQLGPLASIQILCAAMEAGLYCGVDTDQAFLNWWFYNRCPVPWQIAPAYWYIHGEAVKLRKQKIAIRDGVACVTQASCLNPQDRRAGETPALLPPACVFHQYDRTEHANLFLTNNQQPITDNLKSVPLLLLVSHYNEQLGWLDKIAHEHLIISKQAPGPSGAILRSNVGFEAETWAWFFAEYYDELPRVIVCLQGKPFDHITPVLLNEILQKVTSDIVTSDEQKTKAALTHHASHSPVRPGLTHHFSYVPISTPGHKGFTGIDAPDHKGGLPMREWWARLFKSPPPLNWYCPYGGQFAVHRDAVRLRARDYWRNISEHCKTKEDACTLERLWMFVLMGLP